MSSNAENNNEKDFLFVVTGFGPFNGVPENPTSILIKELPTYLSQPQPQPPSDHPEDFRLRAFLAHHLHTVLVETSAQAATQQVQNLRQLLHQYKAAIVLHLGVHGGSNTFRLEQCAYNDATFRVPDERGFQPNQQTVVSPTTQSSSSYEWGHAFTTSFNVPALVQQLNETCTMSAGTDSGTNDPTTQAPSTAVKEATATTNTPMANLSQDPGRFVCNYIYCSSLQAFDHATVKDDNQQQQRPCAQSLFLHVPPFRIVPLADQLEFVTQTMLALYRQQRSNHPPAAS